MTTMPSGYGQYPGEQPFVEQRTSIMAILALVFSLICFLPGPAVLGLLFAVGALVAIGRSGDRLTGRGLAIAGLILSLIVLAVQGGAAIAITKGWGLYKSEVIGPLTTTMSALDNGDFTTARQVLTPEASKRITDADFAALRDSYQAELGKFKGMPSSVMDVFRGYEQATPMMQSLQGRNDAFPVPANFEKGMGLIVFQFDPASNPGSSGTGPRAIPSSVNLMVIAPSGSKWTLYDPQRLPAGAEKKPGDQKPDEKPAEKPADKPEEKSGP